MVIVVLLLVINCGIIDVLNLGAFIKYICRFLQEGLAPINLIVEDKFHRATPGGTGGVKTIGNYASVILLYYFVVQIIEAT